MPLGACWQPAVCLVSSSTASREVHGCKRFPFSFQSRVWRVLCNRSYTNTAALHHTIALTHSSGRPNSALHHWAVRERARLGLLRKWVTFSVDSVVRARRHWRHWAEVKGAQYLPLHQHTHYFTHTHFKVN